jgi:hypothetical protein
MTMTSKNVLVTDRPLFPTPAAGVITNMVPAIMTVHDDGTRTISDPGTNAVWSQQPGNATTPGEMGRRADPNTDGAWEQEYATAGHGMLAWEPGDGRAYVYGYVELS